MAERLKILHILNEIKYSGAEVELRSAYGHFSRFNLESHILSTGENIGNYAPLLENAGYKITHIPFRRSLSYFIALAKYINRTKMDVVHIHTERASFWYAVLSKICGVKTVIRTIHSLFEFKGFLQLKRSLQRSIMRILLDVKFVAISDAVKTNEQMVFGNPCILIKNWIDEERLYPLINAQEKVAARSRFSIPQDAFALISIGSCLALKNHRAIIDALLGISNTLNNVFYLHVGDGQLLESEERYALDKGVAKRINFVGQLEDVREALIASDIFVMPSRYEGLGIVLLESFATGIPVVAYDVKGINSVIKDGCNGLLCALDSEHLADAVMRLYKDETLRHTIIRNGLNTVREEYSLDESVNRLMRLYVPQCQDYSR